MVTKAIQKVEWGPKEILATLTIIGMFLGGASWLQHINLQVGQIGKDLQPIVEMQAEHERRLIVVEQRSDEWRGVVSRLSSLEQQMARQTAILEQLLVRFDAQRKVD